MLLPYSTIENQYIAGISACRKPNMAAWHGYFNTVSVFKTLSYMCLLACGLFFSKDAIDLFLEGKTALQITHEKLTLDDLPVVTICFEGYKGHFCDEMDEKLDWNVTNTWAITTGEQDIDLNEMVMENEVSYR